MKTETKLAPAIMAARMKRLPARHRIAHLHALIRQQPVDSMRRDQLAALLRAAQPGKEGRTA